MFITLFCFQTCVTILNWYFRTCDYTKLLHSHLSLDILYSYTSINLDLEYNWMILHLNVFVWWQSLVFVNRNVNPEYMTFIWMRYESWSAFFLFRFMLCFSPHEYMFTYCVSIKDYISEFDNCIYKNLSIWLMKYFTNYMLNIRHCIWID